MKDKLLSFVVLPSIMFALFLAFSPVGAVKAGVVMDTCIATSCGSSIGTKTVPVIEEVCEEGCLPIHFEWTRTVYDNCPAGFSVRPGHSEQCIKYVTGPDIIIPRPSHDVTKSANVVYNKSNDHHKCHRPSDSTLMDFYGMDHDAKNDFKRLYDEWMNFDKINCHDEQTGTEVVACNDAPIIPCEESCPTECGYPGGTVADGLGGQKRCEPTNSCSTHRWCFPSEESTTGFLAEAISIDITPEVGKPWDSTTMINRYCYERCSVTSPVYGDWGAWIVDNEDDSQLVRTRTITGYDSVDTTYVCAEKGDKEVMDRSLCQYPGVTYADDPLCAPEDDEPEVLGEDDDTTKDTGVVLAATGPTDNIVVYIVELLLVAILVTYSVFFTKTYLKNSK